MYFAESELNEARNDLEWIRAAVDRGQQRLASTWHHQLLWGCITTVGLILTWTAIQLEARLLLTSVWPTLIVIGWTLSVLSETYLVRLRGARPKAGSGPQASAGIWVGIGVGLTLLGTLGMATGALQPRALPMVVSVLLGSGYFATGHLADLGWLRGVGVAWWVVGSILAFATGTWTLLALAGATVVLEIGPALVLRERQAAPPLGA